jgi:hypothetical protein
MAKNFRIWRNKKELAPRVVLTNVKRPGSDNLFVRRASHDHHLRKFS